MNIHPKAFEFKNMDSKI